MNRRIFSAAVLIGGLTVVVKLTSIVKDMLVASAFGTSDALDAFFIALVLPAYVPNIVGGSFSSALVPIYIETRIKDGETAAQRLLSGTVAFSGMLLAVVTITLGLLGHFTLPLLSLSFTPEKLLLTERLFYILLPAIALGGLSANCEAVLNAGERFGLASFTPILLPMATAAMLVLSAPERRIYGVATGTILGMGLQLAILGAALRRRGISLRPVWEGRTPAMRRVIGQYVPMLAGTSLMNTNILVDHAMASMLPAGSVSSLNYGNKLVALALTIGAMALGTAVLPYFSKMVAAADWVAVRQTLKTYVGLIVLVTVPLTCVGLLASKPLIALLFERGNFTANDTEVIAGIQSMYLLQIPFYTLTILFVRMISSLKANHILMWGTVISFTVNISLNSLLMQFLGVRGIALSTTFVYIISCGFLAVMLYRQLGIAAEASRQCA